MVGPRSTSDLYEDLSLYVRGLKLRTSSLGSVPLRNEEDRMGLAVVGIMNDMNNIIMGEYLHGV